MPPGPAFRNRPAGTSSGPALPPEGSERVFARLVLLLRSDAGLKGWTVRAWDDPAEDLAPPATDGPPWLRLTPSPGPSRIHSRGPRGVVHKMPLSVAIELSTPGTTVMQSQRAWGAVLRALFPGPTTDPAEQLVALGVSRIEVHQPAWGGPVVGPDGSHSARCEGSGRIELTMYFTTPE